MVIVVSVQLVSLVAAPGFLKRGGREGQSALTSIVGGRELDTLDLSKIEGESPQPSPWIADGMFTLQFNHNRLLKHTRQFHSLIKSINETFLGPFPLLTFEVQSEHTFSLAQLVSFRRR